MLSSLLLCPEASTPLRQMPHKPLQHPCVSLPYVLNIVDIGDSYPFLPGLRMCAALMVPVASPPDAAQAKPAACLACSHALP